MGQLDHRRIDVFFYGLFMDAELLREKVITPVETRRAVVENFRLVITQRATLVPSNGDVVHGIVFSLTHDEIDKLYADASVKAYRPEAVLARLTDGNPIPCLCFNLPGVDPNEERNLDYVEKLRALAMRLGFPEGYVQSI
jgi:hypothetical protein